MVINLESLIKGITDNMLKTRPGKEVCLRPFKKNEAVSRCVLSSVNIELDKIYPSADDGDLAWVKTKLQVPYENQAILKVSGNADIFLCGRQLFADKDGCVQITIKNGYELVFRCRKDDNGFGVQFVLSTVHYKGMWASDYLYWIRNTVPLAEYEGEEGVAISEINREEYVFPSRTVDSPDIDLNFLKDYGKDNYAYALTYALRDTRYGGDGECFVNQQPYDGGVIKKGSSILVRCEREKGFIIRPGSSADFGLPMVHTKRINGVKWLALGLFGEKDIPEIQFKKPYGEKFWRFQDGSYLRPYLDTSFYGKWFYALMVGQYGVLKASELLGDDLRNYFIEGMSITADYYDLMQLEKKLFGAPSFLERSTILTELDSIGTVGMNLCELYSIKPSEETAHVIDVLERAIYNNIPRFPDGTFHRTDTMWADDTFMSLPFLARLGVMTGKEKHFHECVRQIKGFYKRLYMEDKKLFSHIYFIKDQKPNRIPWGRGNGWVFLTLTEVLERLPVGFLGRDVLIKIYSDFAEGIADVQNDSGMWHQVLDMPETYEETSCTGMFALGMLRGVKNNWITKEYEKNIERAIGGIEKKSIDDDGNILGVCKGSGCSYDPEYYANLGTVSNDDHGTGIILALLSEYYAYVRHKAGNEE